MAYDLRPIAVHAAGRAASRIIALAVTTPIEREVAIAGGDTPIAIYVRDLVAASSLRATMARLHAHAHDRRTGRPRSAARTPLATGSPRRDGGTPAPPFTLADGPGVGPVVAANGERYLVAWPEAATIERAMVNEHGVVTPVHDVALASGTPDPTLEDIAAAPYRDAFVRAWGRYDLRAIARTRGLAHHRSGGHNTDRT